MYRGADVVDEARQGHLGGAATAADGRLRLEDRHAHAVPRELDRGGEAVGTRADDDRVSAQDEARLARGVYVRRRKMRSGAAKA